MFVQQIHLESDLSTWSFSLWPFNPFLFVKFIITFDDNICIRTWGFGLFTWPRTCVHCDTQQTYLESKLRMWSLSLWSFNLCLWANFVLQQSHLNLEFMLWSISMWHMLYSEHIWTLNWGCGPFLCAPATCDYERILSCSDHTWTCNLCYGPFQCDICYIVNTFGLWIDDVVPFFVLL